MRFPLLSKALAIGTVVLLICLMLLRIDALVSERRLRQQQATQSVARSLAGSQVMLGPLLHRRCTEEWDIEKGEGRERRVVATTREFSVSSPPASLQVTSEARSDVLHRGLFKVNTYAGPIRFQADWPGLGGLQPVRQHAGSRLACGPIMVMLSVSDVRGLRSVRARIDGESLPAQPGTLHHLYGKGVHVELPVARAARLHDALSVSIELELVGTERLSLIPAAGQTSWSLRSDWPHPSFGGRFLPGQRSVNAEGFAADWAVSSLASSASAAVQRGGEICEASALESPDSAGEDLVPQSSTVNSKCLETLSVAFIDPVSPYVLTDRATKYALLFIVLTFTCVALVEVLARRRVHPVQYALVGMAMAMFYLLLLSLSEHVSFEKAYVWASSACVALLAFYAVSVLRHRVGGLGFGVGMSVLYGLLWVLIRLEQAALVVGVLMLFAALAAVMVLTRKLDWYALVDAWRGEGRVDQRPAARSGPGV